MDRQTFPTSAFIPEAVADPEDRARGAGWRGSKGYVLNGVHRMKPPLKVWGEATQKPEYECILYGKSIFVNTKM